MSLSLSLGCHISHNLKTSLSKLIRLERNISHSLHTEIPNLVSGTHTLLWFLLNAFRQVSVGQVGSNFPNPLCEISPDCAPGGHLRVRVWHPDLDLPVLEFWLPHEGPKIALWTPIFKNFLAVRLLRSEWTSHCGRQSLFYYNNLSLFIITISYVYFLKFKNNFIFIF